MEWRSIVWALTHKTTIGALEQSSATRARIGNGPSLIDGQLSAIVCKPSSNITGTKFFRTTSRAGEPPHFSMQFAKHVAVHHISPRKTGPLRQWLHG
jgi:hypothetical protein